MGVGRIDGNANRAVIPVQVVREGPEKVARPVEDVKVTGQDAARAHMDAQLKSLGVGQKLNVVT